MTSEQVIYRVQGSASIPYEVIVTFTPFSISCSCSAGIHRDPCKHCRTILHGEDPGIVEGDKSKLIEIQKTGESCGYNTLYHRYDE